MWAQNEFAKMPVALIDVLYIEGILIALLKRKKQEKDAISKQPWRKQQLLH